ncbi:PR domain zinc finger protein 8 [Emydura macquarii macquarii]|uniref:PR domain zinc finger protein 8 n=1 Tax=Emydura macquarii macquarii TaxID=1129001 RepID=UPI00352A812F
MEDTGVQRSIWDGDAKAVQQCLTDIFTSVYTTCDIPENAIFGPCVLSHTSLYDSIAFIALKSTDKRTVPYIFRVDTSAANGSSEGLMWLRLVQSARDKEEQNLEAYIKNGQLFYRSLRRIAKDEELLVWYGKELMELLLLGPARAHSKMNGSPPYTCLECSQRFQFEFPYVAHLRFRCPKRLHSLEPSPGEEPGSQDNSQEQEASLGPGAHKYCKPMGQLQPRYSSPQENGKPSTDFHNLARELENSRGGGGSPSRGQEQLGPAPPRHHPPGGGGGKAKRKSPEEEAGEERSQGAGRGRFAGERPLPSSPKEELVCTPQQQYRPAGSYFGLEESSRLFGPPSPETGEAKRSAFVEVKKASRGLEAEGAAAEEAERASPAGGTAGEQLLGGGRPGGPLSARLEGGSQARGSAFTTVSQLGGGKAAEERKSAFSQPARSSSFPHVAPPLGLAQKLGGLGEPCPEGAARLYAADPLAPKLPGAAELNGGGGGLPKQSPFLYATAFWPKSSVAAAAAGPLQLQLPSALTLLPPSFTSLCLPAQNWCAKCNASFRMTSDLVYHMRSHHKKEYAMEPLVKRRREEKLKCPICNESFRERHHLSRHMTSHN